MAARDVPPPPYSETDIYSNPGTIPQPGLPESPHPPTTSTEAGSTTSTSGDPIYTPPLTPQTTYHGNQSNFAGVVSEPLSTTTPTNPDTIVSSAAHHYFQSRPAPAAIAPLSQSFIEHVLTMKPDSQPAAFPYPGGDFAARDVGIQDWLTFRNFLFPAHSTLATGAIMDRKMQEEEENPVHKAGGEDPDSGSGRVDAVNSPSLEQARHQARETERLAQQHIGRAQQGSTIAEWNAGFFLPRGIVLKLVNAPENPMPGAFEPEYDPLSQASLDPETPVPIESGDQSRQQPNNYQRYNPFTLSGGGIKVGGMTINSNGVKFGNSLVADTSGVRMGRLNIDTNGIRYGNNNLIPSRPMGRTGHGHNVLGRRGYSPEGRHSAPTFGIPQPPGLPIPPMPYMLPQPPGVPVMTRGLSDPNIVRGRAPNVQATRSRSSSAASSLGSISITSSSSESSIGSLPSPADLAPAQLPVMQTRLQEWLALAEHPSAALLTAENVAMLRTDITNAASRHPNFKEAAEASTLRMDIKMLMAEFKALKKRQRRERKKERKEMKMRRRAEKRVRRQQRRQARRRNDSGRRSSDATRGATVPEPHSAEGVPMPPPFGIPVPGASNVQMPPFPFVPGRGASRSGWGSWSWGRGRTGGSGHGNIPPGSTPGPWGHWTPGNWGEQWGGLGLGTCDNTRSYDRDTSRNNLEDGRGRGRGTGRGSSRSRGASGSRPSESSGAGSSLFSGLFPGAWPGENPAEVAMQPFPQTQNQPQRVFHRVSEAKYAAAERLEEQIHAKETRLIALQESIERIERELETGTALLESELQEHERVLSQAEIDAAQITAIHKSEMEELQKKLSGVNLLPQPDNNTGGPKCGGWGKSKDEVKVRKEKIKSEIEMLEGEERKMKEQARGFKCAAQEHKRRAEDKMRILKNKGTTKVVQAKSQAGAVETEIQVLEMSINRLRLDADEQYARELQSEQ